MADAKAAAAEANALGLPEDETDPAAERRRDIPDAPPVGAMIRSLRMRQKLSLAELAELSGVSVGLLSQVERDMTNPSLRTLTRIRHALRVPLSALFAETSTHSDPDFIRRRVGRPRFDLGPTLMTKELLSSSQAQNLQVMILHIPPGGSSGDQPLAYPSEKAGMVLEGEFVLRVDEVEAALETGDSFQFDGVRPHSFRNAGAAMARVLLVISQVLPERHL